MQGTKPNLTNKEDRPWTALFSVQPTLQLGSMGVPIAYYLSIALNSTTLRDLNRCHLHPSASSSVFGLTHDGSIRDWHR